MANFKNVEFATHILLMIQRARPRERERELAQSVYVMSNCVRFAFHGYAVCNHCWLTIICGKGIGKQGQFPDVQHAAERVRRR